MPIQKPASGGEGRTWHHTKDFSCHLELPRIARRHRYNRWIAPVSQQAASGAPVLLKRNESGLVTVGAAHIQLIKAIAFCILDGLPE